MATKKNNRNPYNPESLLYKGLTRLLSGPLTDHDRQNPRQLKRNQLDKYASKFSKASLQPFRKSTNNPLSNQMASFKTNQNRNERYLDFEQMEFYPLINSALDIYADEMTTSSPLSKLLTINCPNEEIKSILEHLYYEVLNIEHNIFGWCRTLCKYGDFFAYLDLEKDIGIKGIIGLPAHEIEIMEGQDKINPNYVQYQWNSAAQTLENWQIAHFRILGNDKYNPYGTSVIEAARRIWRQLNLQEDAMMAYRVVRCLHGESKIWTKNGFKNIKDIKIGDGIYSCDRENKLILNKVTDWIDNGPQKIWRVRSKHRTIKSNFNHPVLTRNVKTNKIEYIQVNMLKPKIHQLVLPKMETIGEKIPIILNENKYEWFVFLNKKGISEFRNNKDKYALSVRSLSKRVEEKYNFGKRRISQFLYAKNKIKGLPYNMAEDVCETFHIKRENLVRYPKGMFNLNRVNLPKFVDVEFAKLFGFMLGDGFMTKNKHKLGFATGIHENINNYYFNIFKKYDSSCVFRKDKRVKNPSLGRYEVNSYYLCNLFEDMGFTASVYTKKVPEWIFRCSSEIKKAFIEGLIDADGTKRNPVVSELELCNKELLEGVKELCHQVGWNVSSGIRKIIKDTKNRTVNGKNPFKKLKTISYYICVSKRETPLYENILEVVETDEISNVYDIRVDNENHNFIADGCVVHNSPERRVFYIDVGGIPEKDVEQYIQRTITETKKSQIIDPDTGRVDLRYNPQSVDEDFYLAVVGNNSGTRIESLPGGQYTGDIDDVKYLRENLMSALKIPQSYLVSAEGAEDKTTLAQKDIQFARTIQRLQRSVASELQKIGIIHLYILGYRGKDLLNFKLHMNNPSKIYELQELEHWNTKFDVASAATEGFFSKRWIAKKIFNLSDEEFLRNLRETFYDAEYEAELENLVASKTEPGGEGMEGDLGGDLGGAGEIPAGEETAEPEAEEESDSMLLASPPVGKRHDKMTTTIRSKGKLYKPVEVDKRDIGARRRHHKSQYADQFARNTFRNVWKGASGMKTAANGIYEDIEAIYRESINEDLNRETEILENDKSIKIMIENLSKNFKKDGDNS